MISKKLTTFDLTIASVFCTIITITRTLTYIFSIRPLIGFLIIVSIYVGAYTGSLIGIVSVLISNCFLGHGLWEPFQIIACIIITSISGLLKNKKYKTNKLILIVLSLICTIVYSISMFFYHQANTGASFAVVMTSYLAIGILKDLGTLLTTIIVVLFFIKPINKILNMIKKPKGVL